MLSIEDIVADHAKWVNWAKTHGLTDCDAEDAVQNVYLWILEKGDVSKYDFKGRVNDFYMWQAIQSKSIDIYRKQKVFINAEPEDRIDTTTLEEYQEWIDHCYECVHEAAEEEHWYLKKFLEYYEENGFNMAKLSRETGISLWSLRNTLKNIKDHAEDKCSAKLQQAR